MRSSTSCAIGASDGDGDGDDDVDVAVDVDEVDPSEATARNPPRSDPGLLFPCAKGARVRTCAASMAVGERAGGRASSEDGIARAASAVGRIKGEGGGDGRSDKADHMVVSRLSVRDLFLNESPYSNQTRKNWGFRGPPRPGFGVSLESYPLDLPYGMDVHMGTWPSHTLLFSAGVVLWPSLADA